MSATSAVAQPRNISQRSENNTSTDTATISRKHQHIDTKIEITFQQFTENKKQELDTTIATFHTDRFLKPWQINIGNSGSVVFDLQPNFDFTATKQLGFQGIIAPYLLHAANARFYNTSKAYTEFWYKVGTLGEQSGELMHTRNFSATNNFSIRYNKFGSPGFFKFQQTNQDHLQLTCNAQFTKRFSTKIAFTLNQMKQDENGGLENDSLLPYANYALRTTIPVVFGNSNSITSSAVSNYFRANELMVQNNITLGFKKNRDSAVKKIAGFQLVHTLKITGEKQVFKDLLPDSARYQLLLSSQLKPSDSLYARCRLQTIQNEFGGQLPNIANGKILLDANFGIEVQQFSNNSISNNYLNNYIKGRVQSNQNNLKWQYNATAQLYLLGNAAGNYALQGFASRKIKNYIIQINANQSLQSPSFQQAFLASNKYKWYTDFSKISGTNIGGTLSNTKHHYNINLQNYTIVNYIYWDSNLRANQQKSLISILSLDASTIFMLKKWSIHPQILLNQVSANAPINLPVLATKWQVAYTNYIFKKSMLASIGIDAFYNIAYQTPYYQPLLAQYSFNTKYTQPNNAPRVGLFFNSKIKRFRVFITADELLQITNSQNRILLQGYAANDYIFRAGFCWVMIN
jgi:Putative porin